MRIKPIGFCIDLTVSVRDQHRRHFVVKPSVGRLDPSYCRVNLTLKKYLVAVATCLGVVAIFCIPVYIFSPLALLGGMIFMYVRNRRDSSNDNPMPRFTLRRLLIIVTLLSAIFGVLTLGNSQMSHTYKTLQISIVSFAGVMFAIAGGCYLYRYRKQPFTFVDCIMAAAVIHISLWLADMCIGFFDHWKYNLL